MIAALLSHWRLAVILAGLSFVAPTSSAADDPLLDTVLGGMSWRNIGPSRGGRAASVAGIPGDPLTYYMGATGGGVWKTEDAGQSWRPVSDGFFKTGSVGALAVAPSDPNVVYAGMGESCVRGNFSHGDGVYKTVNAGKTWTHVGLENSRAIGRIRVHPRNPDHVYVAALGHICGPNEQRGVFRSLDGGATWENVLHVNEHAGAVDIALDPSNPRTLFAGMWQIRRSPWELSSGGDGGGLYRSHDGGDTWTELSAGLPQGTKGKIGVTISPADPNRVWAIVEADDGGVFRSDNGGDSWRRVNEDRSLRQRAWYYSHIFADPQSRDTVYVQNVNFHKSTDGGRSFNTTLRAPHGDYHDLWIAPENPQRMACANDGGACVSFNGGGSWSPQDNQATAQFYRVITDNRFPYNVYGAQQDNSTVCISSRAFPGTRDFYSVGGGESGSIAPDPRNPDIVYAGSYGGLLTRYDHKTRTSRNIMVWPDNPMGWGAEHLVQRFQWNFPIVISPHDPSILYTASQHLFRSTNEGQSWDVISPDLTTNDKSKQGPSGGPITKDNTSVEYYCTIFAFGESPVEAGVLWAGSDDGLVHVSRDGGESWKDVTPLDLPKWAQVNRLDASPHSAGTVTLAVTAYKSDDFSPYIFRSTDFGETWSRIDAGIDRDAFVRAVVEDPKREGLLYAGTETGMYLSPDAGKTWTSLQRNLPAVPITDMVVAQDDLVIATQGRSFWILDDLTQLHQAIDPSGSGVDSGVSLFQPRTTHRGGRGTSASFRYYLQEAPTTSIKLEILEADGDVIKTFEGKPGAGDSEATPAPSRRRRFFAGSSNLSAKQGINTFSWNMRYPDAVEVPGAVFWGGSGRGPVASPGTYQARLTVGETAVTRDFEIAGNPNLPTTQEEYDAQFKLASQIRDRVSDAHRGVNLLRSVSRQVDDAVKRAKGHDAEEELAAAAKAIRESLEPIEEELIQKRSKSGQDPLNYPIKLNNKMAALAGVVDGEFGPNAQAYEVFEYLSKSLDEQLAALHEIVDAEVPAFNELVREKNVPAVVLEKDSVN